VLKRWDGFTSSLQEGRICLMNNAAERALRGFALGEKSWLFAGSDRGADRAAFMATLIISAKLNDLDPQAWLDDISCSHRRHADHQAETTAPVVLDIVDRRRSGDLMLTLPPSFIQF
jgi:transposase